MGGNWVERAFHFFPSSSKQKYGGIANFTYDGSFQAEKHAESLNFNQQDERVKRSFVKGQHFFNFNTSNIQTLHYDLIGRTI